MTKVKNSLRKMWSDSGEPNYKVMPRDKRILGHTDEELEQDYQRALRAHKRAMLTPDRTASKEEKALMKFHGIYGLEVDDATGVGYFTRDGKRIKVKMPEKK